MIEQIFSRLSAVRKVPETIKIQALGIIETLGSIISHGTSQKFADVRIHLRKVSKKISSSTERIPLLQNPFSCSFQLKEEHSLDHLLYGDAQNFHSLSKLPNLDLKLNCNPYYLHGLPESILGARVFRSEERRVGKECRSRWSPYH